MPVQKIDKRDFLLRCWEVFHKQGYYNTSMQELAAATGLQKAGLYHHYPTKQVLMEAVMEFALAEFCNYVLVVASETSLPPVERLEKLLRRHKKLAMLHRQGCFFANIALETGREDLFNSILMRAMDEWTIAIAQILRHWLPEDMAAIRARSLVMEYEGAVLFFKMSGDEQHLNDFIDRNIKVYEQQT